MASDPASNAKQQIEQIDVPEIEELPFSYIDKPSNKASQLLANSVNHSSTDGQSRWYEYAFREPVFIHSAVVFHTNYSDNSEFKFEFIDQGGLETNQIARSKSNSTTVMVNKFIKVIRFKPPKEYFFVDNVLNSVSIFGFDLEKAGDFINYARRIDELRDSALVAIADRESVYTKKIAEAELAVTKVADATKELQSLKGQSQRQRTSIQNLERVRDELNLKITSLRENVSDNERKLQILKIQIRDQTSAKEALKGEVTKFTVTSVNEV